MDWNKQILILIRIIFPSLPLWKCGLKYPFLYLENVYIRHFPCGSVDWNTSALCICISIRVTSLVEVWIEISCYSMIWKKRKCHFPCGSVDWNRTAEYCIQCCWVTSLVEVWIEIENFNGTLAQVESLPLWKCGLKFKHCILVSYMFQSLPLWKCGLKLMGNVLILVLLCHFPCGSVDWNGS